MSFLPEKETKIPSFDFWSSLFSACCQTVLSLPVDFDINKVLGEFFIYF